MSARGSNPSSAPGPPASSRHTQDELRVVAIGGGSGLSTLLRGLKHFVGEAGAGAGPRIGDLSAVVTVTDDGGSSGRLRRDFRILPPGDIRNCMVALSEDEALLSRLFQYRFPEGSVFSGHSFGNIFVTALTGVTGDFAEAVKLSSGILATRGRIFPATLSDVELEATMDDGSTVRGETRITASARRIVQLRLAPAKAEPLPQTLAAIAHADLITIGPGSLFTSLVPNLLVEGIPAAIAAAAATKVYVCNLMTQANESLSLTASEHIRAICAHAGRPIFDVALLNTTPVSPEMRARYALEGAAQVVNDVKEVEALGVRAICGDFLEPDSVARHHPDRLAAQLLGLIENSRGGG